MDTDCDGCKLMAILETKMDHQSKAMDDSILIMQECIRDYRDASLEMKEVTTTLTGVRLSLAEGIKRFDKQDDKIMKHEERIDRNDRKLVVQENQITWLRRGIGVMYTGTAGFIAFSIKKLLGN